MKNTIGKFGYTITKMDEKNELPFDPFVEIDLQHWGQRKGGSPTISPTLVQGEIDGYIAALKADLDAVGASAKLALTRANVKTKAIVKGRVEARKTSK